MSVDIIAFYTIAALSLGLALCAVFSVNLVRAALALVFCFFGVAGLIWLLGSPFLAVVQLVVNAGAIPIVTIFIVMMTRARSTYEPFIFAPLVIFALCGGALALIRAWPEGTSLTQIQPLSTEVLGINLLSVLGKTHTSSTGEAISVQGGTIVAFEVTALVLLVAFIGAILLAKRDDAPEGTAASEEVNRVNA